MYKIHGSHEPSLFNLRGDRRNAAEEQHNHRRESAERAHVCIHESLRRDTT